MREFAVLGDPVGHSLSPRMHGRAFAALGLDATYGAVHVPADDTEELHACMLRLAATGGGGNVTIPHKLTAARLLDHATEAVVRTGACNCFWPVAGGELVGDNTDVAGIEGALAAVTDGAPRDVTVLGAGGAAAAAVDAAVRSGAQRVRISNRTPERARQLVERFAEQRTRVEAIAWPATGSCDVVINATSLGLRPDDPAPSSFDELVARSALDLVYARRGVTTWVEAATRRGIPCLDGREVLVRQAAACYPHWFAIAPPTDILRGALASATEPGDA